MKSLILIAVLAALTVCNDAYIPNEADLYQDEGFVYREDIHMYQRGDVRLGDIMFHEQTCNLPGIPHTVQREDVRYRGNSTTRITGLRMINPPLPPGYINVKPFLNTHMTVRLTAAPGEGLFTTVQIWGHYTDGV